MLKPARVYEALMRVALEGKLEGAPRTEDQKDPMCKMRSVGRR